MGRRKKQLVNEAPLIVHEPESIYMDKMDMLRLSLKEAQAGQLREQIEKLKYQENLTLIEQRAVLASLRAKRREVETQYKVYMDEHDVLLAEIQTKLGINLKDYGVTEEGRLTPLPIQDAGNAEGTQ